MFEPDEADEEPVYTEYGEYSEEFKETVAQEFVSAVSSVNQHYLEVGNPHFENKTTLIFVSCLWRYSK